VIDSISEHFSSRLLQWYGQHGRKTLPWKMDSDPYRIWVSEIMLQQTQVATVIPYFERFMQRFPTVQAVASAPQDDVLGLWAGLGYYARGRNLHKAACVIVDQHGGVFPTCIEDVAALPGIGPSTAGAILSLAFDQRHAILDGNVKRVLARVFSIEGYTGSSQNMKLLWQRAEQLTPQQQAGDYTQAIMDLGAMVCVRSRPLCPACPVQTMCRANREATTNLYPMPKPKKQRPFRSRFFILAQDETQRIALVKRPSHGIWGGLWCVPEFEDRKELENWCNTVGLVVSSTGRELQSFVHKFSHYDLQINPLLVSVENVSKGRIAETDELHFYTYRQLREIGLPAPISKLLESLELVHEEQTQ